MQDYCIHYYNATDHPIDTKDLNIAITPYLIIACMPTDLLVRQSFRSPFSTETFQNTLVITAKPGSDRNKSLPPDKELQRTISRPKRGYLTTSVKACSHGAYMAHRSVSFMHNFDVLTEWYFSNQHNKCGCPKMAELSVNQRLLGVLKQDEMATVATHYVKGLVPYVANHRHGPNASYMTLGPTLPTDGTRGVRERCSQHSTSADNRRIGTAILGKPACGSEGTRVSPLANDGQHGSHTTNQQSELATSTVQLPKQPLQSTIRNLPEYDDIRLHSELEQYNSQRTRRTTNPINISNEHLISNPVLDSNSPPVLVTIGIPFGAPSTTDHSSVINGITITLPQQCYPTESALQAKAKRKQITEEQGISARQQQKANKTNKHVQDHFDDCGSDFTPLQPTTTTNEFYATTMNPTTTTHNTNSSRQSIYSASMDHITSHTNHYQLQQTNTTT